MLTVKIITFNLLTIAVVLFDEKYELDYFVWNVPNALSTHKLIQLQNPFLGCHFLYSFVGILARSQLAHCNSCVMLPLGVFFPSPINLPMGACRNLSICSNVQITKYLNVSNRRQISSKSRNLRFFCLNLEEKSPCLDRLFFVQILLLLRRPPNFQSSKFITYIFIH